MATTADTLRVGIETSLRDMMALWFDMSNEVVTQSQKIGQPVMEAYLNSLTTSLRNYDYAYQKSCKIPETECPPHCACQLDWDACSAETVTATIDIHNTGKDTSQFVLSADSFSHPQDNSGISPSIKPSRFALAAGGHRQVTLTMKVPETMETNQVYRSEIKIAGRYEQFVCLSLRVRKKSRPNCRADHGEIPRRVVAHNWYDHFQCEELCFKPVIHRNDEVAINEDVSVKPISTENKVTSKRTIKSSTKKN